MPVIPATHRPVRPAACPVGRPTRGDFDLVEVPAIGVCEAPTRLTMWMREGRPRSREVVVGGLQWAPEALVRPLEGRNWGKMPVRPGPESAGVRRGTGAPAA